MEILVMFPEASGLKPNANFTNPSLASFPFEPFTSDSFQITEVAQSF